ncbi:transglutaminase family protein [Phenylobacterium montanum]|uniref:Transglutaminase family protein n=1 Tax=Phenylobacterium montanum TaxID=2823693 RepID=A0A975FYM9_9CAUL|nr:transglutaminase family protein [Caulobacter sp. S6]QUD87591.1 transglutaminase family protein [Caulobacter sp. S6]
MIYEVRHLTTYRYNSPVSYARCTLRLTPRETADQAVLASAISVSPRASSMRHRTGPFGERVTAVIVETPHSELKIEATCKVQVKRTDVGRSVRGAPWESVREAALASASLDIGAPANFLYPTAQVPVLPALTDYARRAFAPERPIIEAAFALARTIQAEFKYDSKATLVTTPAIDAFQARRGVCQDFTHIMLAGLRGLGLSAAYVSGYLRTVPPPGQKRLEGADATHAWVDLWCGEALGWIGFDPTNGLIVADDHIELAVGRDYADVSPIDGVILGSGDQDLTVAVDVKPITEAAEVEAGSFL